MSLAQRNLFQNKVRLSLSAVGVALSVMLILILNGFLTGVHRQATAYLDNSPGSVVVVQQGHASADEARLAVVWGILRLCGGALYGDVRFPFDDLFALWMAQQPLPGC